MSDHYVFPLLDLVHPDAAHPRDRAACRRPRPAPVSDRFSPEDPHPMAPPALVPAVPTPDLWVEMELVWRRKHIAFYQGPHAVEPVLADDLDTLHAAEVLIEWALGAEVWPEPVNPYDCRMPRSGCLAPGKSARVSGHDHDDQHLRPRQVWYAQPGEGDGDGPVGAAGAIGRGRGRFIPRQRTEAA